MLVRLHEERAPLPVAAFVGLAEGVLGPARFYDGSIVEIASEQLVMTGGTRSRGLDGPDWEIPDQFHPELRHDRPGVVSLLTEGAHTGSSRFVITRRAAPELDDVYPVFGEVVDGQAGLDTLRRGQTLKRVRIVRVGPAARAYRVDAPGFAELRSQVAEELLRQVLQRHEEVLGEFRRRWPDAVATESGLLYVVQSQGEGPTPDFGAKVLLRYTGSLVDGSAVRDVRPRADGVHDRRGGQGPRGDAPGDAPQRAPHRADPARPGLRSHGCARHRAAARLPDLRRGAGRLPQLTASSAGRRRYRSSRRRSRS